MSKTYVVYSEPTKWAVENGHYMRLGYIIDEEPDYLTYDIDGERELYCRVHFSLTESVIMKVFNLTLIEARNEGN